MASMDPDPFNEVFGLEETLYAEGFKLGEEDGKRDGIVGGRFLGQAKGFEIFQDMGRLHGRSIVLNSRLPITTPQRDQPTHADEEKHLIFMPSLKDQIRGNSGDVAGVQQVQLKPLGDSVRLAKNIRTLYSLTEPESLSLQNKEEDVSEFITRWNGATSKAKVIGKVIGEDTRISASKLLESLINATSTSNEAGIEDANIKHARK